MALCQGCWRGDSSTQLGQYDLRSLPRLGLGDSISRTALNDSPGLGWPVQACLPPIPVSAIWTLCRTPPSSM